ncbi:MAG: hypothetical protein LKK10_10730 [Prevotella sp.]|nr:hypothetical protein [Prevotella sp.]MCI2088733.1 hypothetical protein [Prevotella sp.]
MSIYILMLAVIPCQCEVIAVTMPAVMQIDSGQNNVHKSIPEACSPFCNDAEMHSLPLYFLDKDIIITRIDGKVAKPLFIHYEFTLPDDYDRGVWRPPIA